MKTKNIETSRKPVKSATNVKWHIYFAFTLLCATWFLLTSWIWVWFINVWASYPVGVLSFVLLNGRKYDPRNKRYKLIMIVLAAGLISSIIALLILCNLDL